MGIMKFLGKHFGASATPADGNADNFNKSAIEMAIEKASLPEQKDIRSDVTPVLSPTKSPASKSESPPTSTSSYDRNDASSYIVTL